MSRASPPTLPDATPLRRTRSQAQREQQEAAQQAERASAAASAVGALNLAAIASSSSSSSVGGGAESPTTPARRRTRASLAAAAAQGITVSPLVSPKHGSPSLRVRASAALHAVQDQAVALGHSLESSLEDAGNSLKASCTRYQLIAYDHCPEWLKDNRYIRGSYRANIGWRQSVESACHMHNETVNVWTHVIAFLFMTILLVLTMSVLSPHGVDRLDLDVVLSARSLPQCAPGVEGAAIDPACAVVAATPTSGVTASQDPLEELHRMLGGTKDSQDEMLVELVSRVQTVLPNLQTLTGALKERASQLQRTLLSAMPERATRRLGELSKEGSLSLAEYLQGIEQKLATLKEGAAELLTPGPSVTKEYTKLRDTLVGFLSDFSPDLLKSNDRLDLIPVTRGMLANFMREADRAIDEGIDSLKPAMASMPGVQLQVKIKSGVAGLVGATSNNPATVAGSLLSAGGVASATNDSAEEGENELSPSQITSTVLDADGGGKTVSTAIGYLSVAVHTRASHPGQLELQLHSYLPRYPLAIFLVTAMMCLGFSSTYHLLHAVSDEWARRFQALDYAGIVLLIAGSTTPIIYYGFFCSPLLKWLYISIVWCLGVGVFTIVVLPMYRSPRYRLLKTSCFVALGFSGTVPLCHFQLMLGEIHFITFWLLLMGFCYLSGAAIYVTQVPERWWPGRFDLVGSSHQLWHLSIFAAVLFLYVGLIHMFEWRMTRVCMAGMAA